MLMMCRPSCAVTSLGAMVGSGPAVYVQGPPPRVTLRGHLGPAAAARLREALATAIGAAADTVVVDVSRVDSMNSAVLRTLIAGRRLAAAAGVSLLLHRPSEQMTMLLACTGLRRAFAVDAGTAYDVTAARSGR
jgi:anti-anti-sigma factor